jgi:lipid A 4'-phosphatase
MWGRVSLRGGLMRMLNYRVWAVAVAVCFVSALIVFLAWPQIDLRVTALFFQDGVGFPGQSSPVLSTVRHGIWNLSIGLALIAIIGGLYHAVAGRDLFGVPGGRWQLIALLYVLGPGLLVNAVLKNLWGRARPDQIIEFGGSASFSPAWVITDQCARNCSFVSGEGSGAAALAIGGLLVLEALRSRLWPGVLVTLQGLVVTAAITGAALRVVLGRHFLSDTVFAALLVAVIALLLWPVFARGGLVLRRAA